MMRVDDFVWLSTAVRSSREVKKEQEEWKVERIRSNLEIKTNKQIKQCWADLMLFQC